MMLKHIKDMGEEQITRLATRLLSNESFVLAVQTIVSRTLRTKDQLEGGLRTVLANLAVPTSEDLDVISERMIELEAQVTELSEKVEEMERKQRAKKPSSRKKSSGASSKTRSRSAES